MPQDKFNIYLVDDDRIYQFTAKKTLETIDLTQNISIFSNGEEAIEHIKEKLEQPHSLPDVIFLDINMPLMDGWQFLDEYVKLDVRLKKNVTIYMVSSSVDEADIKKSKEYEVIKDYIIKPIGRERFEDLLNRITK